MTRQITSHSLTSLTAKEIKTAVAVIKQQISQQEINFPIVTLNEPDKTKVLNRKPGQPFKQEVFTIVYDRSQNKTYEAVINLKTAALLSWQEIPGVQPAIVEPEYDIAEQVTEADSCWRAAMRKRSITDLDRVVVDVWAAGLMTVWHKKPILRRFPIAILTVS